MVSGQSKSLETKNKNAFTSTAQQVILSNSNSRDSATGAPSISKISRCTMKTLFYIVLFLVDSVCC